MGDRLELIHPSGNFEVQVERIHNAQGEVITRIPGSDHRAWLPLPAGSVGAFIARFI